MPAHQVAVPRCRILVPSVDPGRFVLPLTTWASLLLVAGVLAFGSSSLLRAADPPPLNDLEQARINLAIENGAGFLKRAQGLAGNWGNGKGNDGADGHAIGYTALAALTLLECGESANKDSIKKAAAIVRSAAGKTDATYEVALTILFLDRLGDPKDKALIQAMGGRLIAGQSSTGGWNYKVPILDTATHNSLFSVLKQMQQEETKDGSEFSTGSSALTTGKPGDKSPGSDRSLFDSYPRLPRPGMCLRMAEVSGLESEKVTPEGPKDTKVAKPADPPKPPGKIVIPQGLALLPVLRDPNWLLLSDPTDKPTDNSNTQFALLALWVSQRHGVPMERTMNLLVNRFLTSQNDDGGWGYKYKKDGGEATSPPMNAVGLLGLAVGHGLHRDAPALPGEAPKKPVRDQMIIKGFRTLTGFLGNPAGRMDNLPQQNLYFLWSIERVSVLYGLKSIGNKDWYRWGAEILVANQLPTGEWDKGGYPGASPVLDTCLALLFLKRANLAADLTARLPFDPSILSRDISQNMAGGIAPTAPSPPPEAVASASPPPPPPPVDTPRPTPPPTVTPPANTGSNPPPAPSPPANSSAQTQAKSSNGSMMLGIIIVAGSAILLLGGGALALYFFTRPGEDDDDRPAKKGKKPVKSARPITTRTVKPATGVVKKTATGVLKKPATGVVKKPATGVVKKPTTAPMKPAMKKVKRAND
jgi:hypothetical protein